MKLKDIIQRVDGELLCGDGERNITTCCASDLMSDVLTLEPEDAVLITGLCTNQALHTAEMSDIESILFIRNKRPDERMIELANENGIALATARHSMFQVCGMLYKNGLNGPYAFEQENHG